MKTNIIVRSLLLIAGGAALGGLFVARVSPLQRTQAAGPAAPANGASLSCTATTIQVSASDASGIASAQVSIDGGAFQTATFNSTSGKYELSWTPTAGAHTIIARATDSSCNANVGNAAQISVTGSCGAIERTIREIGDISGAIAAAVTQQGAATSTGPARPA